MNQAIYFTPWYEYPIQVQNTILILLHASSFNTMELWIGPFAPQNVQTALQVWSYFIKKKICSSDLERVISIHFNI